MWQVPVNHDTAFLFLAGERYLDGERLFLDQSMVNPPLATWMHAIPAFLSRVLNSVGVNIVIPFVLLAIGASLLLAGRVLALFSDIKLQHRAIILVACFLAITLAPLHDFAQRDHLFMVFSLPLILLTAVRLENISVPPMLAGGIGIFSFFGLALKPHFLLLPLALEIFILIKTKKLSKIFHPEIIILGASLVVYALLVIVFYPEYFLMVIPRYTQIFFAFTNDFYFLALKPEVQIVMMAVVVYMLCREQLMFRRLLQVILIAIITTTTIYFLQKKGWSYQRAPMLELSTLFFIGCLISWKNMKTSIQRIGMYLAVSAIAVMVMVVGMRGPYSNVYMKTIGAEMEPYKESSVYFFTTNVSVPFPMVMYEDITPASRFNTLWMMPGLIRKQTETPGSLPDIESFARDSIIADFVTHNPAVVVVDARTEKPYFNNVDFDYIAWALQDPRFQELWYKYKFLKDAYGFKIYVRE